MTQQNTPTIGYIELIRTNREFRWLWLGQIVSLLGDWFNLIASASLIALLTGSGLAVGGLFVIRTLAPFLISPVAGVVSDRYNRKMILIVTDLARGVTVLGFLLVRDASDVWLLYVLTAVQLGISGFFFPTRNAILPDLVEPEAIGTANALSATTWSVMLALGAAIGGFASGLWGVYPAFMLDAVTFVVSAVFLAQISADTNPPSSADSSLRAAIGEYVGGLRYLAGQRHVLVNALHKAAIALTVASGFQVVQVAIAERVFVYGEGGGISLGLLYGINGVGTGIGPILLRRWTGDDPRLLRRAILLGYIVAGIGLAVAAPLWSFGFVLFGALLRGFGGGVAWVFSTQLLLQMVSPAVRGRVFANENAFFNLASAGGAIIVGASLESSLGITGSIWLMVGMVSLPAVFWFLWLSRSRVSDRPQFQDMPSEKEQR